jgi:xanthine dehydrogenase YagT iron-sulfur-binding subunit
MSAALDLRDVATRHTPVMLPTTLQINGRSHEVTVDSRATLLDTLRETLGLTGSKKGCDHGQCGACTVLVDGVRVNACLCLTVMQDGRAITTVEGLAAADGTPHALQDAFIAHDAFQCGYCTPGQLCSAVGVLAEIEAGVPSHVMEDVAAAPNLTETEIRERMSGNLCRCGAYPHIVEAVLAVGER